MKENVMKTGTTTVGVVAKDCVILAADKRATAGTYIADKKVDKIFFLNDRMAITTAGVVSDIQMIGKVIKAELALKDLRSGRVNKVKEAANLTAGFVYSNIRRFSMVPGLVHFLFGGHDITGNHLYDIYPDGSISVIDDFVSTGSGSMVALGVLESHYTPDMSKEQAIDLALKAVGTAIRRDCATGEGIDVCVIDTNGANKVKTVKI